MEAQDAADLIRELLSDVPEAERPRIVATAIGLAFGRVEQWDPSVDRVGALIRVLAAACEEVADGPQSYAEARTDRDWMVEFLEQAKGASA